MRECGQVVAVAGEFAQVKVVRGDRCGECRVCQALGEGSGLMEARNTIGAAVGDMVEVEVSPKVVVGHSSLVFIFPLLLFLVGYFIGRSAPWPHFMSAEARGIIAAFVSLGVSFFLIRAYDRRLARAGRGGPEVVSFVAPPLHDGWTAN